MSNVLDTKDPEFWTMLIVYCLMLGDTSWKWWLFMKKWKRFFKQFRKATHLVFLKNKLPRCRVYGAKRTITRNFLSKVEFQRLRIHQMILFIFCVLEQNPFRKILEKTWNLVFSTLFSKSVFFLFNAQADSACHFFSGCFLFFIKTLFFDSCNRRGRRTS